MYDLESFNIPDQDSNDINHKETDIELIDSDRQKTYQIQ